MTAVILLTSSRLIFRRGETIFCLNECVDEVCGQGIFFLDSCGCYLMLLGVNIFVVVILRGYWCWVVLLM